MVTAQEIRTFKSASSAELQRAQSLIFAGKAFAARGDPRLQRIIAVVGTLNQVARDEAIAEAQAREQLSLREQAEALPVGEGVGEFDGQITREILERAELPPTQRELRFIGVSDQELLERARALPIGQPLRFDPREIAEISGQKVSVSTFLIAKDVGGGRMQDFMFTVVDGRIVDSEPRDTPIPQSRRFIEAGRVGKSDEQLVREAIRKTELLPRREALRTQEEDAFEDSTQRLLERARALPVGVAPEFDPEAILQAQRVPTFTERALERIAEINEQTSQFLGFDVIPKVEGISILPRKRDLSLADINTILRKGNLGTKVVAELIPETALGILSVGVVGGLAGGLAGRGVAQLTRAGIVISGTATAAQVELKPETRIAGALVAGGALLADAGILKLPRGKKGQTRFAQLAELLKKAEGKKPKLDLEKVINELRFKRVGKTFRDKTQGEKIAEIKKAFDELKKVQDPELRTVQGKAYIKILEETYGKEGSVTLLKDYLAQEALIIPEVTIPKAPSVQPFFQVGRRFPTPPQLQATRPLFILNTKQLQFQRRTQQQITRLKFLQSQATTQKQKDKLAQAIAQKQFQISSLQTGQAEVLAQVQAQPQLSAQAAAQLSAQVSKQATKQLLSTKSIFFRARPRARPRVKPKPLKKIKIPKGQAALVKKLLKIKKAGQSVDIITGLVKKRVLRKRVAPNRAVKIAQEFVDRNIEASYRLKINKKKPLKKDIKKVSISPKFRASKTNPLFQVEKKKFRLDTKTEVLQIKARRKKAKKKKSTKKTKGRKK